MLIRNHFLVLTVLLSGFCGLGAAAQNQPADTSLAATQPAPARQQQLRRMLEHDCGSCHGLRLTGGLGPAIHAEAMQQLPQAAIAATIFHGRPGTPMPAWKSMISEAEADWLAAYMQRPSATKPALVSQDPRP
ncbi:cytochrome c55X [Paucibacter oligotrophus]|uniref:Cytochrome c55X n=1 Tax=Roseateles oligotrophus TaxID=1769250 RepID=A0A840LBI6_9BURK|nr:cytochrome c [Roseateles oligotrophus]MBB4844215.1 cytochrome c55X [Roseateles oligotrophus]